MFTKLSIIALGGAFGALSRYGVSGLALKYLNPAFPFGTLIVNLVGSFLIGFFYQLFDQQAVSESTKGFIFAGFLGAFTTFSTFSLDTVRLFQQGDTTAGLTNILINNVGGILLVLLGIFLARALFGGK